MSTRFPFMALALTVLAVFAPDAAPAAVVQATGDKYMYPFINDLPADERRGSASAFGAYGAIDLPAFDFDDRDAQFFLDFATAGVVPPGQGASSYRILSLTVTIVVENNDIFFHDPSFDLLGSYTGASSDSDAGRPMELYGVGYRSGWTRSTFTEDSPFQTEPSSSILDPQSDWNRKRNAFALDFTAAGVPRDVSNNVEEGFEVHPWALADSPGYIDYEGNYVAAVLEPGSLVPEGRVFRFQVDLTNPHIVAYLQDSLHSGRLHLMVSSLHGTTQQSTDIPRFYTKDHDPAFGYYLGPQLEAEVLLMPSLSVTRIGGGYRVAFETVPDQRYQIEHCDHLGTADWRPLGGVRDGTGESLFHDDLVPAGVNTRYYRISVSKNSPS